MLVLGGGAGGLLTAMILANGGHSVTVLERDPEPPPATDDDAWHRWDRTGVNQFRQPHGLLGRTRQLLCEETPAAWEEIERIGIHVDLRPLAPDPAATDERDAHLCVTAVRRVALERHLALTADAAPDVEVRRGVVVTGLTTGTDHRAGSPHVTGVTTAEHGKFSADLVVDACGRRTPVGEWVEALGCPVERSSESDGFTYFSRWYQLEGDMPALRAGMFGGLVPGLLVLVFPGDGNTVGIAMVGTGGDRILRRLRDPDRFTALAQELPLVAPWVDPTVATPLTEVMPMGAIQNRHLRFRTDDAPGVTGLVNAADSVVSTNPSLGRGIAIAGDLAIELRHLLADEPDPTQLSDRWDTIQQHSHLPWMADSIQADRLMRDAFTAMAEERPPDAPAHPARAALQRAATVDMECWRRWTAMNQVFVRPPTCFADDELMTRAADVAEDAPPPPPPSISRSDLATLLQG